ncbi:MAG: hypothetical protein V2G43_04850 [bacterium JZ-2024 1]
MKKNFHWRSFLDRWRPPQFTFLLIFFLVPEIFLSSGGGAPPSPQPPSPSQPPSTGSTTSPPVVPPPTVSPPPSETSVFQPQQGSGNTLQPEIRFLNPLPGAWVTSGTLTPLTILVQILDPMELGIVYTNLRVDYEEVPSEFDPATGILSATVTGLSSNRSHGIEVTAVDARGNRRDATASFRINEVPPYFRWTNFEGSGITGFISPSQTSNRVYLQSWEDLDPAVIEVPSKWSIVDPHGVPLATIVDVKVQPDTQSILLTLDTSLPIGTEYRLNFIHNGIFRSAYQNYVPDDWYLHQLPEAVESTLLSSGDGGQIRRLGSGRGSFGRDKGGAGTQSGEGSGWQGYSPPKRFAPDWNRFVNCTKPDDGTTPENGPGGRIGGAIDMLVGGPPPPDPGVPPKPGKYYVCGEDPSEEGEGHVLGIRVKGNSEADDALQEVWIINDLPCAYDLDMTHDLSWNGNIPPMAPTPPYQGPWEGKFAYACEPYTPTCMNYYDYTRNTTNNICFSHYILNHPGNVRDAFFIWWWDRGGKTKFISRFLWLKNGEVIQECWLKVPGDTGSGGCGSGTYITPFDEIHPFFENIRIITGRDRRNFVYSGNGIVIGRDPYMEEYDQNPSERANDRFIQIIADDLGSPQLLMIDNIKVGISPTELGYACGDRAYLSQEDPTYTPPPTCDAKGRRNIDRIYCTKTFTEEDLNHVCDWGWVAPTYFIDEPAFQVTPGNPPVQKPCYDEKGNKIGDADCSPLFEKAVWFVPLDNMRAYGPDPQWELMKYWVRVDDNVGSWRVGPPGGIDPNIDPTCGSPCVEILEPAHTRQYVNLEKNQSGRDECGLNLPPENGNQTCAVIKVSQPQDGKKITKLKVKYEDPAYRPPPDNEPTNPGVADDFGCKRNRNDNRATHTSMDCRLTSSTHPGFICTPNSHCANPSQCTASSPCQEVEILVEDPPNSGQFHSRIPIIFQTSAIGGDNYKISAYDLDKACSYKTVMDMPLTVWRKVWVSRSLMPDGGEPADESIPSERPLDRPYFPYWFVGEESVPGAFDDAFYEVVEAERSDSDAYFPSIRSALGDFSCGQSGTGSDDAMYSPAGVSYPHNHADGPSFPHNASAPFHPPPYDKVQLLGTDGIRGRNGVWDRCGIVGDLPAPDCQNHPQNGIPETDELRWTGSGWEDCGVLGATAFVPRYNGEMHAFVGVGDIRRVARSRLNNKGKWVWGAERWPGATDRNPPPPPPSLPESTGEQAKRTFCDRHYCPGPPAEPWQNFLLIASIHELGHAIGNLIGDTENCGDASGNPLDLIDQSVMDYQCIRLGFGPDEHGVKWFSRNDILQMRQGGEPE